MLANGAPVEIFEEIDSTILEARRRAEFGDYGPVWLLARAQTAGRGRRGRPWSSPTGNLYATYLGLTGKPPAEIALLGFAAGLAIAETLDARIGANRARLKWPNDVLIDDAKISGIMLDSGAAAGGGVWFALAFGVNINSAPQGIDQPTVSLGDLAAGSAPPPEDLLGEIRPRLERWAERLDGDGFAPLRDAWVSRAHGLGRAAEIRLGEERIAGVLSGLSARGELEMMTQTGPRAIAAGDVHFPSPNAA